VNLRDTVARAIYGSIHPIGGWGTWVDEGGDSPYHAHADAVLAALGLDDLDAAAERMEQALEKDGWPGVSMRVALAALLTPPEASDG
jgi:hypothetical protein